MVEFVRASPKATRELMGRGADFPALVYVGVDDGKPIGAAALTWVAGRCWLEFSWIDIEPQQAIHVVRNAKRMLDHARQVGEIEVFALRDDRETTSKPLLTMLGFEFDGVLGDREVWSCSLAQ